ncbi:Uncharacterized protein conserved in archaea [Archaeoglobus sulfaticallidus PM70-1]|uniref:Uncharacterized protein conserved in archaea n=1 Tax=Archaeoglobus sulfaticallidus PM70-1 TaxID=387631 RepID=N0BDY5_9EURY|nr:nucleotidyltransferase domain-containing protein [Archaeoglobus sulfaticallidus]AGK61223.1 Uncharacterized protein conserved in archaea [Archaeoglobus sulfaticallidus PM70-1]
MKPIRLRDFVKADDFYFSIVGYKHIRGVKAFLRYVPSVSGDRISREGKRYRKLMHSNAIEFAKKENMEYYNSKLGIFLIPNSKISEVYKPEERISEIVKSDDKVKRIVDFFNTIPVDKMGVTGSRLIGLESEDSDVDFVMYGSYWFKGREKIKRSIERGVLKEPSEETWNFIFEKRKVNIPYDIFVSHERRKFHRAIIGSTYFDLLYVRDYDGISIPIPEDKGKRIGKKVIRAEVVDDSHTFDYPAYYPVRHGEIAAVLSFTHTYVGQGVKGEVIEAKGVVEEINGRRYLIVGTSREVMDEYIVSLTFMKKSGLMDEFERWKGEL